MIEKGTVILSLEQYESLKEWEKMHDDLEINVDNLKRELHETHEALWALKKKIVSEELNHTNMEMYSHEELTDLERHKRGIYSHRHGYLTNLGISDEAIKLVINQTKQRLIEKHKQETKEDEE